MLFNSLHFVLFLAAVFLLVLALGSRVTLRNLLLLAASYYFYAIWNVRFLLLIVGVTAVNYGAGLLVHQLDGARRKQILAAAVTLNLLVLGFFKYWNFFIAEAAVLIGRIGLNPHLSTLQIILPIGISFYTFQSISYLVDVHKRRVKPERNALNFALFIAFFPQLVAGPIERAKDMLPQIRTAAPIHWESICSGFYLVCWGMFKKVVLADNLAKIVDPVFKNTPYHGADVWIGCFAFMAQLYCDFSGYTDIGRGSARMIGFDLSRNFLAPFVAYNPRDFWRRWHITLTNWFRDYVYAPIRGQHKTMARLLGGLIVTFALMGLWHGASRNFILFGLYHGVLLAGYTVIQPSLRKFIITKPRSVQTAWRWASVVLVWIMLILSMPFFRGDNVYQVYRMLVSLVNLPAYASDLLSPAMLLIFASCCIASIGTDIIHESAGSDETVLKWPFAARTIVYAAVIMAFILFGEFNRDPFIYFQF